MTLHIKEIDDKEVWEKFLQTYSPQALFQSWFWGEVEKKAGHTVLRLALSDSMGIIGIAQVFMVRARRGTFLHIRHGPVWKDQKIAYWEHFFTLLRPIAQKERAWFIRISPLVPYSEENQQLFRRLHLLPASVHEVDAERCWVLDIDKTDEELLMGMRKTTRYEIRQAQKLGVVVKKSTDKKDLKHFFALYSETSKRHGFVAHGAISEEFEVFTREGRALLLLGYDKKELVAGTIVLFYGNQAIYHHGASIFSKVPVSYLVQWEAIQEAKKRGIKLYNFYGIAPDDRPNHPWRGITLFKKGFGGREVRYIHAHDYPLSSLYVVPKVVEAVRRRLKGY